MEKPLGLLITNTGTPDSPDVAAVRRYLKEFLSDPHVVHLPGILWKPLLNLVILPKRAPHSARLYQNIWTPEGSPLRIGMDALREKLADHLSLKLKRPVQVEIGMHYGQPTIRDAIEGMKAQGLEDVVVLPLFPQYSGSTTEATRAQVKKALKKTPGLRSQFVSHYADHPAYLDALSEQIRSQHELGRHLLFSFHGLPQRFIDQGDPYATLCHTTASQVAERLQLSLGEWSLSYQSRFGYAKWLGPYTFETLQTLPQRGIREISVVCPGFSIDCLETLEEIKLRGRDEFFKHGGKIFHYIPALNDSEHQVKALGEVVASLLSSSYNNFY